MYDLVFVEETVHIEGRGSGFRSSYPILAIIVF